MGWGVGGVNRCKTLFITPSCWPRTLELLGEVQNCQLLNLQLHTDPMTRAAPSSIAALPRAKPNLANPRVAKHESHARTREAGGSRAFLPCPVALFCATPMVGGDVGGVRAQIFPRAHRTRAVISFPSMIATHNHQHHKQESRQAICVKQLK